MQMTPLIVACALVCAVGAIVWLMSTRSGASRSRRLAAASSTAAAIVLIPPAATLASFSGGLWAMLAASIATVLCATHSWLNQHRRSRRI